MSEKMRSNVVFKQEEKKDEPLLIRELVEWLEFWASRSRGTDESNRAYRQIRNILEEKDDA